MSSIPKDERILLREINRSGVSAVIKSRRFPPFLAIFSPTHSQVDRCRDVKLIFAGKGVGETLNILVHRRSGRSRTATIYHSSPPDGKTILSHRFPPFSFTTLVSRLEKGATRIDPSVARDELPANAPPKQIFAPEKETFHLSRCRRFLNVSPNLPTCRCSTHFRSQSHHATEPYSINVPPIKPRSTFRLSRIIIGRRVLRFLRFETSRKERRVEGRNRNIKILSYRSRPRP